MPLRLVQVSVKARDGGALGRFWADALGWSLDGGRTGATVVPMERDAGPPRLAVVPVSDPGAVHHRVHLDLATTSRAHQSELVARLEGLGATRADIGQGDVPWTVMADPEGNVFCVLEPREVYRDTGPVAAVVLACDDPAPLGRFWSEAIGWPQLEVGDGYVRMRAPTGVGPFLELIRTPGLESVRSRSRFDVRPKAGDDVSAEVARLRALGATDLDVGQGEVARRCLADPEGNELGVLDPG